MQRLEVHDGELIVMPPASTDHGMKTDNFHYLISHFVRTHRLGRVFAAETGFTLHRNPEGRDVVRAPDVAFVSHARMPAEVPTRGYAEIAPDLVVEVVSPNDDPEDIQSKIEDHLRYGVRLVWVAYPRTHIIMVYTPDSTRTLRDGDTLPGADVLPGFSIPVADLFA
jgi:Uma2 family endonuclease